MKIRIKDVLLVGYNKPLKRREGVSPVIGVIITVAITVIIASIAYVWFTSLTADVGKETIKPIQVRAELNIERIHDELQIEITIGSNIDWNDYKVTLNGEEILTDSTMLYNEGDKLYFDYRGPTLNEGQWYELNIIDLDASTVVFSEKILAKSYAPEGPGVYGFIKSQGLGIPIPAAAVSIYKDNVLENSTSSDSTGAYELCVDEGEYEIICEVQPSILSGSFKKFNGTVKVGKYNKLRYDIVLEYDIPQNSTLSGHLYDNATDQPIPHAEIILTNNNTFFKIINTDENGRYASSVPSGNLSIFCSVKYYLVYRDEVSVEDNTSMTYDIYLENIPPQAGVIHGHVYDKISGETITEVKIVTMTEFLSNSTRSNETGFYRINVVPGSVTVSVSMEGYSNWEKTITVLESEVYLLNIYLN